MYYFNSYIDFPSSNPIIEKNMHIVKGDKIIYPRETETIVLIINFYYLRNPYT